jgi:hypothetical protein
LNRKRITVNVSPAEYAELIRLAKAHRRTLADQAGVIIASVISTTPTVLT